MITNKGKRVCDAEIRLRSGRWRSCKKPAKFTVGSKNVSYMELDYCARHARQFKITEAQKSQDDEA